jgi:FkbM family methyltransferase
MKMQTAQNLSNKIKRNSKIFLYGLMRKLFFALKKEYLVSKTCQIENIVQVYELIDLNNINGTFVEIGAFDGETHSNTSFLADKGWKGIYIEPIPEFAFLTRLRHLFNNVKIENVAISDKTGTQVINKMSALTTLSEDNLDAYTKIDWAKDYVANMQVEVIKTDLLESVFKKYSLDYKFDLLVVDVEGSEEIVIKSLINTKWRPKNILIELEDNHQDFQNMPNIHRSHKRVREMLVNSNYNLVWKDDINSLYKYGL